MELTEGNVAVEFTVPDCIEPYLRMCNGSDAVEIEGKTYVPMAFDVKVEGDSPGTLMFAIPDFHRRQRCSTAMTAW